MEIDTTAAAAAATGGGGGGLAAFLGGSSAANDCISDIEVYLFIWDRYRMIAKDFILQMGSDEITGPGGETVDNGGDPYSNYFLMVPPMLAAFASGATIVERQLIDLCCIYSHECMTRWFIMMDHHMCRYDEFVTQHKHQNGEQLFRLITS